MSNPSDDERGFQLVDEPESPPEPGLGTMSFATLVISLSTSALVHLGARPDDVPEGAAAAANLPLAKQTIEILEVLERKTEGNLDDAESRLLEDVLHDLRMRFVAARAVE